MHKQAVIFDMDGVLIDSETWYFAVKQRVFARTGARPQHFTLAETAGLPETDSWELLFPDEKERTKQEAAFRAEIFAHPVDFRGMLKPGVRETLRWLHTHDLLVGLASAGPMPYLQSFLDACGFNGAFDKVVSGEDITRNKPDPMIYKTMLTRLALPAASCVAIEDSAVGIAAATGAGIETWAVRPVGYELDQRQADVVIAGAGDIPLRLGANK